MKHVLRTAVISILLVAGLVFAHTEQAQFSVKNTSNRVISAPVGGYVVWTGTGYTYRVSALDYIIAGDAYSVTEQDVTLSAADGTNPRIDVIAVNTSNAVIVLEGSPAANPVKPSVDAAEQLELTFITVPALSTSPADISIETVYDENNDWTCTASDASHVCNSTNNPRTGTLDVEATSTSNNDNVIFDKGSTITLADYNVLVFYIRSKAAWSGNASITITPGLDPSYSGGVVLKNGDFGFDSSNTSTYQQIIIPTGLFTQSPAAIDALKLNIKGSIGYYIDDVSFQGGLQQPTTSESLVYKGVWSASASYAENNVVTYSGATYVSLETNTNVTPGTSATTWEHVGSTTGGVSNAIFLLGADTGSVLEDTEDQPEFFCNESGVTLTISKVVCRSDAGTPSVNIQKDDGSPTDMMASALSCSTAGASQTSFVSGENVIPDGTCVDFVMGTAGGVAKRITFNVTTTGGQSGVGLSPGDDIGAATATTPAEDDNDTSVATTAYVQTEITGLGGGGGTLLLASNDAATPDGGTFYFALSGESTRESSPSAASAAWMHLPAGTFSNMNCRHGGSMASGESITINLAAANGTEIGSACVIGPGNDDVDCSVAGDIETVVDGTNRQYKVVFTNLTNNNHLTCNITFTPS